MQILAPHVAWFLYDGYFIENYMEYFAVTERVKQGNMSNNASPLLTPSNFMKVLRKIILFTTCLLITSPKSILV